MCTEQHRRRRAARLAMLLALVVLTLGLLASSASAFVYWPNIQAHTIGRANLDGSASNPNFITLPASQAPYGVAVDDAHIYWADRNSGAIGRANLDGTGVNPNFITGGDEPTAVAVSAQYVMWMNSDSGYIGRADIDGSEVVQDFWGTGVTNATVLAADNAYVYWNGTGGIVRAAFTHAMSGESFIPVSGQIEGLAVTPAFVYVSVGAHTATNDGAVIERVAVTGSGGSVTNTDSNFAAIDQATRGMAAGPTGMYFGQNGNLGHLGFDGTGFNSSFLATPAQTGAPALDAAATAAATNPGAVVANQSPSIVGITPGAGVPGVGGDMHAKPLPALASFQPIFTTSLRSVRAETGHLVGITQILGLRSGTSVDVRCVRGCTVDQHFRPTKQVRGVLLRHQPTIGAHTTVRVTVSLAGFSSRYTDYRFVRRTAGLVAHRVGGGCSTDTRGHSITTCS